MGGVMSRDKGQRGERQVADMLSEAFPHRMRVRRNIDQVRDGGEDIAGIDGFSLEVKWHETWNLNSWWKQCVQQAMDSTERVGAEQIPALVYKRNRVKWRVRVPLRLYVPYAHIYKTIDMSWEDFITVIKYEHGLCTRQDGGTGVP